MCSRTSVQRQDACVVPAEIRLCGAALSVMQGHIGQDSISRKEKPVTPTQIDSLAKALERDIAQFARNQVLIDRFKTVTRKDKFMLAIHRFNWLLIAAIAFSLLFWIAIARAEGNPQCPTPGQQCRILFLNADEETILVRQNGILDTAAQGRMVDLSAAAAYFKLKLSSAPMGEVKPVPTDKPVNAPAASSTPPVENKPAAPVDK